MASIGLNALVDSVRSTPSSVGLFSDLDGTLSSIVDDPDSVVPVDGATDCLEALADLLGLVAVVSGRPVSFLERFFAPPIELSGLYGLEHRTGDRLLVDPIALDWLPVMSQTADLAREHFGTEAVEDKRYSLTVHYRGAAPEFIDRVTTWASETAATTGLDARAAKMSVELHPPTSRSKGDAVEDLLGGIHSAVYFGDDVGDLPAFKRLHKLRSSGVLDTIGVVLVDSHETAPELHEYATDIVNSPAEALDVLWQLRTAADNGAST